MNRNMIRIPSRGEVIPLHRGYLTEAERQFDTTLREERDRLHAAYDRRPTTIELSYRKAGKRFSDEPSLAEFVYVIAGAVVGLATIWWLS